jgi:HD-GYP domain-containing protein (c-di-GMP phosphodiesterase class II)
LSGQLATRVVIQDGKKGIKLNTRENPKKQLARFWMRLRDRATRFIVTVSERRRSKSKRQCRIALAAKRRLWSQEGKLEHKRKSKKATGKILDAAAGSSNEVHCHCVRTQKKQCNCVEE